MCCSWLLCFFSSWSLAGVPRKVLWLQESYQPHHGWLQDQLFFIVLKKKYMKTLCNQPGLTSGSPFVNQRKDQRWRWLRTLRIHVSFSQVYAVQLQFFQSVYRLKPKCTCTGGSKSNGMCVCVSVVYCLSLLHRILNSRQRLLYWHRGVRAAGLLGELQDRHVA